MKKKVLASLLCVAMASTMLVGCGGNDKAADAPAADAATDDAAAEDAPAEEYISNEQASTSLGDLLSKFKL